MIKSITLSALAKEFEEKYGRKFTEEEVLPNAIFQTCIMNVQEFVAKVRDIDSSVTEKDAALMAHQVLEHTIALSIELINTGPQPKVGESVHQEYISFVAENSGFPGPLESNPAVIQAGTGLLELCSQLGSSKNIKEKFVNQLSAVTKDSYRTDIEGLYESVEGSLNLFELK